MLPHIHATAEQRSTFVIQGRRSRWSA